MLPRNGHKFLSWYLIPQFAMSFNKNYVFKKLIYENELKLDEGEILWFLIYCAEKKFDPRYIKLKTFKACIGWTPMEPFESNR